MSIIVFFRGEKKVLHLSQSKYTCRRSWMAWMEGYNFSPRKMTSHSDACQKRPKFTLGAHFGALMKQLYGELTLQAVSLYPVPTVFPSPTFPPSFHPFIFLIHQEVSAVRCPLSSWLIHVAIEGDPQRSVTLMMISTLTQFLRHHQARLIAVPCCTVTRRRRPRRQLMHATSLHMLMKIRRRTLFRRRRREEAEFLMQLTIWDILWYNECLLFSSCMFCYSIYICTSITTAPWRPSQPSLSLNICSFVL